MSRQRHALVPNQTTTSYQTAHASNRCRWMGCGTLIALPFVMISASYTLMTFSICRMSPKVRPLLSSLSTYALAPTLPLLNFGILTQYNVPPMPFLTRCHRGTPSTWVLSRHLTARGVAHGSNWRWAQLHPTKTAHQALHRRSRSAPYRSLCHSALIPGQDVRPCPTVLRVGLFAVAMTSQMSFPCRQRKSVGHAYCLTG